MSTLGQRLKWCRERCKCSQGDASDKTGLTKMAISNYERDYREPDIATLIKLADVYHVSVQWLVVGNEVDQTRIIDIYDALQSDAQYRGVILDEADKRRIVDMVNGLLWDRL